MEDYFPQVIQAIAGKNYCVYAYFTDGSIKQYNAKWLVENGTLNDESFVKSLTILNGTVAWDLSGEYDTTNCIDIDPFTVYKGQPVRESDFWVVGQ